MPATSKEYRGSRWKTGSAEALEVSGSENGEARRPGDEPVRAGHGFAVEPAGDGEEQGVVREQAASVRMRIASRTSAVPMGSILSPIRYEYLTGFPAGHDTRRHWDKYSLTFVHYSYMFIINEH